MRLKFAGAFLAVMFALVGVGSAYAASSTAFSGFEVFPGYHGYNCPLGATCGTTFSGWTDGANTWVPLQQSDGGSWTASLNYTGTPGIGGAVNVTGGRWAWLQPNGTLRFGPLLRGHVSWPSSLTADIGCGSGVAQFQADIATTSHTAGTISGCLDDTHLAQVFPPRVWGMLSLN